MKPITLAVLVCSSLAFADDLQPAEGKKASEQ